MADVSIDVAAVEEPVARATMSLQAFAEQIGMSPQGVFGWQQKGHGPKAHIVDGQVQYYVDDVQQYINQSYVKCDSRAGRLEMQTAYVSEKVVSGIVGQSTGVLFNWRGRKVGPSYMKFNGTIRYRLEDVTLFLEQRAAGQGPRTRADIQKRKSVVQPSPDVEIIIGEPPDDEQLPVQTSLLPIIPDTEVPFGPTDDLQPPTEVELYDDDGKHFSWC